MGKPCDHWDVQLVPARNLGGMAACSDLMKYTAAYLLFRRIKCFVHHQRVSGNGTGPSVLLVTGCGLDLAPKGNIASTSCCPGIVSNSGGLLKSKVKARPMSAVACQGVSMMTCIDA